jgi:hypothetical protein
MFFLVCVLVFQYSLNPFTAYLTILFGSIIIVPINVGSDFADFVIFSAELHPCFYRNLYIRVKLRFCSL